MTDPTFPFFPIASGLGFLLAIIPLPWHLQAWNSGTCFFMMWTSISCLNQFVNSIVWAGNALNPAPAWCEISIRIMMGASVGIPAASLCINRRLYLIAKVQTVGVTRADKLKAIMIDTFICLVVPLIHICLQYVVQGHRFDILEDVGCYPALYNTLPTYFISYTTPLVIGIMSACYCVLSLREFSARRAQFGQLLASNTSLTMSRYFRLMALAMTDILLTTPLSVFVIWLNATATPISPWISWEDTHFDFSRVDQIPALFWRSNSLVVVSVDLTRWIIPICSFIFFGFFGFADEARRQYRRAFLCVRKFRNLAIRKPEPSRLPTISQFHKASPTKLSLAPMRTNDSFSHFKPYPLDDLKRTTSFASIGSNTLNASSPTHVPTNWPKSDQSSDYDVERSSNSYISHENSLHSPHKPDYDHA